MSNKKTVKEVAKETLKPAHEIKMGSIRVSIWKNGKETPFYSISIGRRYKSGETWKTSASFGERDLPLVKAAFDQVEAWLKENPIA